MLQKITWIMDDKSGRLYRIAGLIAAYLNEDIRDSEFRELNNWINECSLNKAIFEFITNASFLNSLNQEKWN